MPRREISNSTHLDGRKKEDGEVPLISQAEGFHSNDANC